MIISGESLLKPMYDLIQNTRPISDHKYQSGPIWQDDGLQLSNIQKLEECKIGIVIDLLYPIWRVQVRTKKNSEEGQN